ncbi:MAG: DUF4249 family protein, partial [Saprospiraceae bacterium]|nr:DUF4249 family protein [Saprospiraceae bacterium]
MKKLIYFLGFIVIFAACEDVIDVNLESGPPQVVVDAWLTNEEKPQEIKLTLSQDYLNSSIAEGIDNAAV